MEEAVGAAVRFAAERAAETEREDVREIERLLAAFAAGGVTAAIEFLYQLITVLRRQKSVMVRAA